MRQKLLLSGGVVICAALAGCTANTGEPSNGAGAANTPQAGTGSVIPSGGGAMGGAAGSTSSSTGPSGGGSGAPLGGTAGASTMGGATGGGAAGATSGGGHMPTAGCSKPNMDEPGKDVLHDIMVAGVARRYWTRSPTEAPLDKPFPVVFWGPGCGATGVEGAPLDDSIRKDAMRVFVIGVGACFDTKGTEPETGYFNAVLDEVQANYCTDTGRVFVSGYSSGAWFSDVVACTAGDRITAIGTAAGGFHADHPPCKGTPAAMFHAGTQDGANPIVKLNADGINEGSSAARDRMLMANGCSMDTTVWDPMYPYCKQYAGCSSPVVWCEQAVGHSNGEEVSRTGWWKFWSSLP